MCTTTPNYWKGVGSRMCIYTVGAIMLGLGVLIGFFIGTGIADAEKCCNRMEMITKQAKDYKDYIDIRDQKKVNVERKRMLEGGEQDEN